MSHESRAKQYKNINKHEEMRRRRTEGSIELRKQKKDDQLMKRRNVEVVLDESDDVQNNTAVDSQPHTIEACVATLLGSAPSLAEALEAVRSLRKLLSASRSPPVDGVIAAGLLAPLKMALDAPNVELQFEAAWALTNIVSGTAEQTLEVLRAGALPSLVRLLYSEENRVAEQAAWAIGNIAGDCASLRDTVSQAGAADAIVALVNRDGIPVTFKRTLAWTVSNLCRHKKPPPSRQVLQTLMPTIAYMLDDNDLVQTARVCAAAEEQATQTVVTDVCWATSYVSDGSDEQIQLVVDQQIIRRIVGLMQSGDVALVAPSLRALGNTVTGNDVQTQAVVDSGVLDRVLPKVLGMGQMGIVKECCWMLSNIVAGTQAQIQAVINAELLPWVVKYLEEGDGRTRFEAMWVVANLCQGGTREQIMSLIGLGVVPKMCALLKTTADAKLLLNVLESLGSILDTARVMGAETAVEEDVERSGGLDSLEELQHHATEEIYGRAYYLIDTYFGSEEELVGSTDKENAAPVVPQGGYNF